MVGAGDRCLESCRSVRHHHVTREVGVHHLVFGAHLHRIAPVPLGLPPHQINQRLKARSVLWRNTVASSVIEEYVELPGRHIVQARGQLQPQRI
ncbi:Uncharacterised protein [Mycobacteroides abscessus subsp. abscessus]|nr:Uncharacterised protein [Mycobacteroides abscessus subsp. abscessus]